MRALDQSSGSGVQTPEKASGIGLAGPDLCRTHTARSTQSSFSCEPCSRECLRGAAMLLKRIWESVVLRALLMSFLRQGLRALPEGGVRLCLLLRGWILLQLLQLLLSLAKLHCGYLCRTHTARSTKSSFSCEPCSRECMRGAAMLLKRIWKSVVLRTLLISFLRQGLRALPEGGVCLCLLLRGWILLQLQLLLSLAKRHCGCRTHTARSTKSSFSCEPCSRECLRGAAILLKRIWESVVLRALLICFLRQGLPEGGVCLCLLLRGWILLQLLQLLLSLAKLHCGYLCRTHTARSTKSSFSCEPCSRECLRGAAILLKRIWESVVLRALLISFLRQGLRALPEGGVRLCLLLRGWILLQLLQLLLSLAKLHCGYLCRTHTARSTKSSFSCEPCSRECLRGAAMLLKRIWKSVVLRTLLISFLRQGLRALPGECLCLLLCGLRLHLHKLLLQLLQVLTSLPKLL